MKEITLSIIKPGATQHEKEINDFFVRANIEIIEKKFLNLKKEEAAEFYKEHKEKGFFDELCNFMSSGEIIVQILKGENVILRNREIMGNTNPKLAEKGTIRNKFGISIEQNAVHGSDSKESAIREIKFFFPKFSISE